jgi:hypothetical protein
VRVRTVGTVPAHRPVEAFTDNNDMKKLLRHVISATARRPLAVLLLPFISDAQGLRSCTQSVWRQFKAEVREAISKHLSDCIGFAGILRSLFSVGGFELIYGSSNPTIRAEAQKRIWAALGGLLLVLASVTILGTINPAFTGFSFKLGEIAKTGTPGGAGTTAQLSPEEQRQSIARLEAINVAINRTDGGTDAVRLPDDAYEGIEKLTKATGTQPLTGGAEPWRK